MPLINEDQAREQIKTAFKDFERNVNTQHARQFHNTSLEQVWQAVTTIEQNLAAKGQRRSFRRLKPLLTGLEHYSKAVEVLCNGTPYLPWIWSPITLCLQIACDHISALEKLLEAYAEIGEALPRFDTLSHAFKENETFQSVLAMVYCDIMEFHKRAYKVFNASIWIRFFEHSWARFDYRFKHILDSLKRHTDLVDKEASALNISSMQSWREKAFDEMVKMEKYRQNSQFQAVMTWLDDSGYHQDNLLDALLEKHCPGTSDWFLEHSKVKAWMSTNSKQAILWVNGKPGCGKSILAAQLINHLDAVAYHICSLRTNSQHNFEQVMRSLAHRLVKRSPECVSLVYNDFVMQGEKASVPMLKKMMPLLLAANPGTRIIIDGLDECDDSQQTDILKTVLPLVKLQDVRDCKVMIFSQDVSTIQRQLKKHVGIRLEDEKDWVDASIKVFTQHELEDVRSEWSDLPANTFEVIERSIVSNADGMFLWARLVVHSLKDACSEDELLNAMKTLPHGINEAYHRIVQRMATTLSPDHLSKVQALLSLLMVAERPIRSHEALDAIFYATREDHLSEQTRLQVHVFQLCKPLVEVSSDGVVSMVHFSAKEYLSHDLSGPFLTIRQAAYSTALACVTYMLNSFELVDGTDTDSFARVVKGFHGLHDFAQSFWLHHVEQYVTNSGTLQPRGSSRLETVLDELCIQCLHDQSQQDEDINRRTEIEARATMFRDHESLQRLARRRWQQEQARSQAISRADGEKDSQEHSTVFQAISIQYQNISQSLLQAGSESTYPSLALHIPTFRAVYGTSAFTCRSSACPRNSDGFATSAERDEHERGHAPILLCPEAGCQFGFGLAFPNQKRLQQHVRKYHFKRGISLTKLLGVQIRPQPVNSEAAVEYTAASPQLQPSTPINTLGIDAPVGDVGENIDWEAWDAALKDDLSIAEPTKLASSVGPSNNYRCLHADCSQSFPSEASLVNHVHSAHKDHLILSDYYIQVNHLEQQNQRRLMAARAELDNMQKYSPPAEVVEMAMLSQPLPRSIGGQLRIAIPSHIQQWGHLRDSILQYPYLYEAHMLDSMTAAMEAHFKQNPSELQQGLRYLSFKSLSQARKMPETQVHNQQPITDTADSVRSLAQTQRAATKATLQRPPNDKIQQQIFAKVMDDIRNSSEQDTCIWQSTLHPQERADQVMQVITCLRGKNVELGRCITIAQRLESTSMHTAQNKHIYKSSIQNKLKAIQNLSRALS